MESGKVGFEMAMVLKSGLMELNMKEIGRKELRMAKVLFNTLMVTHIKGTGRMIRQSDMEPIVIQMEPNMRDFGKMIFKKEKALNIGPIVHYMKEIILRVRNMALESIGGATEADSWVNGKKIKSTALVYTSG